ncbi:MAG: T9SS type A sorting domain-containing protein [Bacteroidetes bacterium]|nr:MAG: T9SS type A sorting domain-containing protein [Bacteroidota bacterium]
MKTLIITLLFILYISSFVSAQYANLQVKEGCEKARKWYTDTYYSLDDPPNISGEPERLQAYKGIAEAIQSHITMYRVTKDKAHLIKAINMGLGLVSKRTDVIKNVGGTSQIWADSDTYPDEKLGYWYEGFTLAALAELAYIMISEPDYFPELISQPLPVQLITNPMPAVPLPPVPLTTYGAIGSWFRDRVNETMTYYGTVQWSDDAGFLYGDIDSKECDNKFYHQGLEAVNQHAPLTVAAMYLKAIDATSFTNSIPGKIADFYLGQTPVFKNSGKDNPDPDDDPRDIKCDRLNLIGNSNECQSVPIMHLNPIDNSYWWFYHGWSKGLIEPSKNSCANDCRRACSNLTTFLEDFGHADFTMEFPMHSIPFGYFSDGHMIRWRNTFAKLIWDPYHPLGPGFHTAIIGSMDDDVSFIPCKGIFDCNGFWGVPLMFMPLYKFDGADATATSPNVYDIVMGYYQNDVEQAVITNDTKQSNRSIYGLSRLASAQWDKECTNNTLYNRDVVYDQDFFAKNILTIAPQQTTDVFYTKNNSGVPSPFADPETFTDGGSKDRFVIEAGTTVNMRAGERIVVKSGSSAKSGCNFHAYIDPTLASECMDGMRVQNTQNTNRNNSVAATAIPVVFSDKQKISSSSIPWQFSITPNPTSGLFTLQLPENLNGEIFIYNHLSQIIHQQVLASNQQIDLSSQPKGIYFVKVQSADKVYTEKVVVQ